MSNVYPTFATPVTWNSETSYNALSIVLYNGHAYTSKQNVPAGTPLSNTNYWFPTGNLYKLISDLKTLKEFETIHTTIYTDTSYTDVTYNFTNTYSEIPYVTVEVFTATGTQANVPVSVITNLTTTSVTVRLWKQYGVQNTSGHNPMASPTILLGVYG